MATSFQASLGQSPKGTGARLNSPFRPVIETTPIQPATPDNSSQQFSNNGFRPLPKPKLATDIIVSNQQSEAAIERHADAGSQAIVEIDPKNPDPMMVAEKMIDFFEAAPMTKTIIEVMTWKTGEVREVEKEVACPPPMIGEFARSIGVKVSKLKLWNRTIPEFAEAVEECNEIVKEFIVKNGLSGKYPSQFAIFAAKNLTDMKDKQIHENRTVDINKVLDKLEKGNLNEVYDGLN